MPATRTGLNNIVPTSITSSGSPTINNTTGRVTFSNVSGSGVYFNGVFSDSYDNYLVVFDLNPPGSSYPFIRFSSSGSPDSTNYWYHTQFHYNNSVTYRGSSTTASTTGIELGRSVTVFNKYVYIASPFLSDKETTILAEGVGAYSNASSEYTVGLHEVKSSFDGFVLDWGANITGTISVYGYTK